MRTLIAFCLIVVVVGVTIAQQDAPLPPMLDRRPLFTPPVSPQARSERPLLYKIPGKKASQYTAEDWGTLIDTTWGPGQSAADQLNVFDTFWTQVRQQWGGFPNLALNCSYWDSVANVYRPQIGSGLSRGRFYALMSRMWMALSELHTYVSDLRVDTTFGYYSFQYRPGVPLLITGSYLGNMLGAAVTPLPDSTNVVYRVAPGNPLGLEPGDLILGYEGVPWKHLYPQLLAAGVPLSYVYSFAPSTPASAHHFSMMGVGSNWGLFDTIDVLKFTSGDTLHLPTALLDTTLQTVWLSDQVPVAGVPMPQAPYGAVAVSWGVVQGTNIGYIYVWDWASTQTQQLFQNAVNDLVNTKRVEGLVLDFRMNWGGNYTYGNSGLSQLFNFDPTVNLRRASRSSTTDCMFFTLQNFQWGQAPGTLYDHPIAVLIGPGCFSAGDLYALRMRSHPMARFFGKPTNGAFVEGSKVEGTMPDRWIYGFHTGDVYSLLPGEGHLIHKGVQPDEAVWLTREGVAAGQDEVVNHALTWVTTLSYAHDVVVSKEIAPAVQGVMYAASDTLYTIDIQTGAATRVGWIGRGLYGLAIRPSTGEMYGVATNSSNTSLYRVSTSAVFRPASVALADSIRITAKVENPQQHTLAVFAIITDRHGLLVDSVLFSHTAGDSLWRASIRAPADTGKYDVSVRTEDLTAGSFRRLPNVTSFTDALSEVAMTIPIPNMRAIAFTSDDTLYGATRTGQLYRINLTTGDTVSIGPPSGLAYASLSFNPATHEMWASVSPVLVNRDNIYKVNLTTGVPTLVGATLDGAVTPAIAFDTLAHLYGLKGTGIQINSLISIDTATGTGTLIGSTGVAGLLSMTTRGNFIPPLTTVSAGWNMISNPVTTADDSVLQLFPTSMFPYAFGFEGVGGYQQSFEMANGAGYWGKFPAAGGLNFTGETRTLDTIEVATGWNMVGSITTAVDTSTIVSIPAGLRSSTAWFEYNGGYSPAPTIRPGKGYWVKANAEGLFVFTAGPAPQRAAVSGNDVLGAMNSMTITDGLGHSQRLYFGPGDGTLQYEMPPPPPDGAFDARFETGEGGAVLRTHLAGATLPISIQSAVAPVTVFWSIRTGHYMLDAGRGPEPLSTEGSHTLVTAPSRVVLLASGSSDMPTAFALLQNYPNPFNPSTTITFAIPRDGASVGTLHATSLQVFDLLGRQVARLVDEPRPAGVYTVRWDATGVSSGVYLYRLKAGGFVQTKRMMVVK